MRFFPYVTNTQAYQWNTENRKNESLVGLTPGITNNKSSKVIDESFLHVFGGARDVQISYHKPHNHVASILHAQFQYVFLTLSDQKMLSCITHNSNS